MILKFLLIGLMVIISGTLRQGLAIGIAPSVNLIFFISEKVPIPSISHFFI